MAEMSASLSCLQEQQGTVVDVLAESALVGLPSSLTWGSSGCWQARAWQCEKMMENKASQYSSASNINTLKYAGVEMDALYRISGNQLVCPDSVKNEKMLWF